MAPPSSKKFIEILIAPLLLVMVLACSFGLYRELQAPLASPELTQAPAALPVPTSTPQVLNTPAPAKTQEQKPRLRTLAVRNVQKPPPVEAEPSIPAVEHPHLPRSTYPQRRHHPVQGIAEQIASGRIQASFHGTGEDGGMVFAQLYNPGPGALQIHLKPGMILQPPIGHDVQPLLLEDEIRVTLKPGESFRAPLNSYCMDSQVPAPGHGESVDYQFVPPNGREAAVAVLKTAQRMDFSNRRAVIQIAIWKSLGQPVHQFHFVSVMGASAHNPAAKARVLRDVERLLQAAKLN